MKDFEALKTASTSEVLAVIAVLLNDIGEKLGALTAPAGVTYSTDADGLKEIPVPEETPEEAPAEAEEPAPAPGHTRDDIRSAVRKLTAAGRSAEGKQCVKVNGYSAIKDIKDKDIERIYGELTRLLEAS
ncbi:MAG: hypothetical protein IJR33_08670 [Clostridia bacterium]|nr:hypothetical protein [Clostridia bacterium]